MSGGSILREKFGYTHPVRIHLLTLGYEAYHLGVHGIRPQSPDSSPPDHLVAVDVLLRHEPDEEEDEDEGSRKEEDDNEDESDDGYSE